MLIALAVAPLIPIVFQLGLELVLVTTADVPQYDPRFSVLISLYYGLAIIFGLPLFAIFEFAKWRGALAYFIVGFIAGFLIGSTWTTLNFWEVGRNIFSPMILRIAAVCLDCLFGIAVGISALTFRRLAIDWGQKEHETPALDAP